MSQQACADYSTDVLTKQPQIGTQEEIITQYDVDQAWKDQIAVVDRWIDSGFDDEAQDEIDQALAYAEFLQEQFEDQCKRRVYNDDGTWYVIPKYAEAKIKKSWYQVEVLESVVNHGFWAVQVRALPIDGWQPHPFTDPCDFPGLQGVKAHRDTGSVPLENIRVNGQRLGSMDRQEFSEMLKLHRKWTSAEELGVK